MIGTIIGFKLTTSWRKNQTELPKTASLLIIKLTQCD